MNRISCSALVSLVALCGAPVAQAQSPAAAQDQMVVSLGGLNLNSDAGAQIALQRIQSAARRFCGEPMPRSLVETSLTAKCHARMVDKAVTQVNAERLTALYRPGPPILVARNLGSDH